MRWQSIVKRKSLGPADKIMPKLIRVRYENSFLTIRSNDFGVVREIFGAQCYLHKDWLDHSTSFLDLGANEGIFTLFALSNSSNNRVTAIEAQPLLTQRLNENIRLNGYSQRCSAYCGYVGNANEQLTHIKTALTKIDMDMIMKELGTVDFMKVDIEGSEFELFSNCSKWINQIRFIAMEVHPEAGNPDSLMRQVTKQGFNVSLYKQHGDLAYLFLENIAFGRKA